ncbi:hypothetical protein QTH90_30140 [Variovorax sp. J2P1-59]|uniref:hypothetical protein n=1 Tax=Variovorax flavidus TaxID=3053501 RepID=UPI002575C36F|nr:hypothetical protein [Variovorax sp. J2P1-59]MDM0078702.1 hypothetical protein [Variovorax sp. J2P1-59]
MSEPSAPTEEALFTALGAEVLSTSRLGTGVSDGQKAQLGRGWFKGHLQQIQSAVCGNKTIEDLATKGDTTALVAAATPLLGFSPTVAASATIALLIARIGVRRICAGEWTET